MYPDRERYIYRMSKLTHINEQGAAHMVDISAKAVTSRTAIAETTIHCSNAVIEQFITDAPNSSSNSNNNSNPKGDVFAAVRIAGIQGAKKCSDLIPLCHPLPLSKVVIDIAVHDNNIIIQATCKTDGKTGVEMEALTAASVAALTFYDMCKAIDKSMVINNTRLLEKTGGKSGNYHADKQSCE